MANFTEKVYAVVRRIKRGQTLSYKQVATAIGKPQAFRAVAKALAKNTDDSVPCHRVIKSDGSLGGYNGRLGIKAELLKREKVL